MEAAPAVPPPGAAPSAAESGRGWLVPLLVLIVGMFMSVLDISIVNVAIPTMQRDFGSTVDDIEWISTAYTLSLGVVVPMSGWLGDRFGLTKVYLICLVGFAAGSALCGFAWDLGSMVAFRILQAIPGGILPVITMAMLYAIVPREKIGSAMGLYGLGVIFGPAIGPTLGGYLVEYTNWRLIFFINVPIGLAGAVAGYFLLAKMPPTSRRPFDWWGFVTAAFGLFALLLACSEGQSWGWDSYPVLMLIVFGLLSLALFAVIELERDEPLIDLRVFNNWPFVNSLLLISVLTVGLFAVLFYLPLFMQGSQGISPLKTGLILLPEALVMGLIMPFAGKLYDLVGPRIPGVIGLAVACWGGYLLCGINPDMTEGEIILWTCIRAAGNGLAMMPLMTAGMAAIPQGLTTSGSLVNNVIQRVASSLGLAAMTVIATRQQSQLMADQIALIPSTYPELSRFQISAQNPESLYAYFLQLQVEVIARAYSNVFLVAAALTGVGVLLALLMKKPPVNPQMPGGAEAPTAPRGSDQTADQAARHGSSPSKEPASVVAQAHG